MKGVFDFADVSYNLRNQSKCNRSIQFTEKYGIEVTSSLCPKLQEKVPPEAKSSESLEEFKVQIKGWVPKPVLAGYENFIKHVDYL